MARVFLFRRMLAIVRQVPTYVWHWPTMYHLALIFHTLFAFSEAGQEICGQIFLRTFLSVEEAWVNWSPVSRLPFNLLNCKLDLVTSVTFCLSQEFVIDYFLSYIFYCSLSSISCYFLPSFASSLLFRLCSLGCLLDYLQTCLLLLFDVALTSFVWTRQSFP